MTPSTRFRILCRDGFRCRYCGARAPDVELQVDHIHPRSLGGDDGEDNLVTACRRCNIGKGAILLPKVEKVSFTDLGEKIAKLLQEYELAVEEESPWQMSEVLEQIRHMGAMVDELGGFQAMQDVHEWVEQRVGFDIACHLDPHWDGIGDWRY